MNIQEEIRNDVTIVRVDERLVNAAHAPALRDALMRNVQAGHTRIIVDLSTTEYMDSSALGAIVSTFQKSGSRGAMAVVGGRGAVARLMSLTRMDRILKLHSDMDAAVEYMLA